MKKTQLKTAPTRKSVKTYLGAITDEQKKEDCIAISKMMEEVTKEKPVIWGDSIVGFGKREMTYASGRTIDWLVMGFSPRKDSISIYLTCDLDQMNEELKQLGKHKRGVGCLYIKKLEDIDTKVLKNMMKKATRLHA